MHQNDDAGLTLIELVVAIGILGILAGIVVASIGNSTTNAAANSCATQIDSVQTAIRRYVSDGQGRLRDFDSIEDVNTRLVPDYIVDELQQTNGFTIAINDGVVTGTYGVDNTPCP